MIVILNGALGVGKTATSWALLESFPRAVMLDGDYLGAVHPFDRDDPARVSYLYRTLAHLIEFHRSHGYANAVVNYVFESPESLAELVRRLKAVDPEVHAFRLTCEASEHEARIRARGNDDLEAELIRGPELARIQAAAAARGFLGEEVDTTGADLASVVAAIRALIPAR